MHGGWKNKQQPTMCLLACCAWNDNLKMFDEHGANGPQKTCSTNCLLAGACLLLDSKDSHDKFRFSVPFFNMSLLGWHLFCWVWASFSSCIWLWHGLRSAGAHMGPHHWLMNHCACSILLSCIKSLSPSAVSHRLRYFGWLLHRQCRPSRRHHVFC